MSQPSPTIVVIPCYYTDWAKG